MHTRLYGGMVSLSAVIASGHQPAWRSGSTRAPAGLPRRLRASPCLPPDRLTSPSLEIALSLPAGHHRVVGLLLYIRRIHVVLDYIVAEDFSGQGTALQELRRFP
jgi:hypothetical protein